MSAAELDRTGLRRLGVVQQMYNPGAMADDVENRADHGARQVCVHQSHVQAGAAECYREITAVSVLPSPGPALVTAIEAGKRSPSPPAFDRTARSVRYAFQASRGSGV